jgi:hypothetical protein
MLTGSPVEDFIPTLLQQQQRVGRFGVHQRAIGELRRHKGVKYRILIDNLVHFWSGVSRKSRQPIRGFSEGKGDKKV